MIRIRAFRSLDDSESCKIYSEGHKRVLTDFNITQITTNSTNWYSDANVYAIVVESEDGTELYGGTRIHVKSNDILLPVEEALSGSDNGILKLVETYAKHGTGELCALWNARKMTGKGYSVLLTRAAIARACLSIADQLNLKSIFVLCGPYTVSLAQSMGFVIETSVGDKGTFIYPRPDLLATVLMIKDLIKLEWAHPSQRADILSLRQNPRQHRVEAGPKGPIEVEYDLLLTGKETFKNQNKDEKIKTNQARQ